MDIGECEVWISRDNLIRCPAFLLVENVNIPHSDAGACDAQLPSQWIGPDMLLRLRQALIPRSR